MTYISFRCEKAESSLCLEALGATSRQEMRTFWGRKGKPITLPCTLSTPEDTNFSLEWRKENKLILSAYGSEDGHAAPSSQVVSKLICASCDV
ncbi:hypothetical protein Q1695_000830 [Nippostrongylus brasiliensis]|nr:hypothetical protein Q1695_000830 [Nippostrongylus brasiliensis]